MVRVAAILRRSALELTLLLLLKLASLPKQSRTRLQDQVCSEHRLTPQDFWSDVRMTDPKVL